MLFCSEVLDNGFQSNLLFMWLHQQEMMVLDSSEGFRRRRRPSSACTPILG